MHSKGIGRVLIAIVMVSCVQAQQTIGPWDRTTLYCTPQVYDAAEYATNDVKTVFYEGEPYHGKPTRIFAYYGVPEAKPGAKVPGIVLIHGGGGSAFVRWVKLWNARGYAAISMDTCGAISGNVFGNEQSKHQRHSWAGPAGWGGFDQLDDPIKDQWTYHAVAAVVRGHSLLRSLPGVDPDRIGVTGISWGGYLTCIVAGVDDRFTFAVPVYGCGFLREDSAWTETLKKMKKSSADKWEELWDPSSYLPLARAPFLWVTGSNDFAYHLPNLQKSYRALKVPYTLAVRLRMPHGHGAVGEKPSEILSFADQMTRKGAPLPRITQVTREDRHVHLTFECPVSRVVAQAELNVTSDRGAWKERKWTSLPVTLDSCTGVVTADIPESATVYYINLFVEDGQVVSSVHEEL